MLLVIGAFVILRAECLGLRGSRGMLFSSQMCKESLYFGDVHFTGMTFIVKETIAPDPIHVGLKTSAAYSVRNA